MEPSPISTQALPAGTRIEEFMIEKVLGSGGFGITYLARDTGLNRQVVIKENLPVQFAWRDPASGTVRPRHTTGGDADDFAWSLTNFLREAETLASLDHPGIVRVLSKFEACGTAYFVMPFVEGLAFDELIETRRAKGQPFSGEEITGLLKRMLSALAYLHDRGIYHRDIKPGNILISNEGVPALIDFGSARQRLSERSMTVVESAGYTPFEQLQSRGNVGPWSDLYALAATLVKAITFEAPPKAADRIGDDPMVPLASRKPLAGPYSTALLDSIDRALAVNPKERWQSAGEWRERLKSAVPSPVVPHVSQPFFQPRPVLYEVVLPSVLVLRIKLGIALFANLAATWIFYKGAQNLLAAFNNESKAEAILMSRDPAAIALRQEIRARLDYAHQQELFECMWLALGLVVFIVGVRKFSVANRKLKLARRISCSSSAVDQQVGNHSSEGAVRTGKKTTSGPVMTFIGVIFLILLLLQYREVERSKNGIEAAKKGDKEFLRSISPVILDRFPPLNSSSQSGLNGGVDTGGGVFQELHSLPFQPSTTPK